MSERGTILFPSKYPRSLLPASTTVPRRRDAELLHVFRAWIISKNSGGTKDILTGRESCLSPTSKIRSTIKFGSLFWKTFSGGWSAPSTSHSDAFDFWNDRERTSTKTTFRRPWTPRYSSHTISLCWIDSVESPVRSVVISETADKYHDIIVAAISSSIPDELSKNEFNHYCRLVRWSSRELIKTKKPIEL